MEESQRKNIIAVLRALDEDWAAVDEKDEDDFVIFVDESRDVMEDFYPKKEFIREMERLGFLEDTEKDSRPAERETGTYYQKDEPDGEWTAFTESHPIVYFYKITKKGQELLNAEIVKP